MEPSRQQAVRSDENGRGCDSARSASFNAHYMRQDTLAIKKVMNLRRVVNHPFTLIFGARLDRMMTEQLVSKIFSQVTGAEATYADLRILHPLSQAQIIDPVLFEILAGLSVSPAGDLLSRVDELAKDLPKVVTRNWLRLDVLAMYIDEELRRVDPRPRTQDQPGVLTFDMLKRIIDKMTPGPQWKTEATADGASAEDEATSNARAVRPTSSGDRRPKRPQSNSANRKDGRSKRPRKTTQQRT